MFRDGFMSTFDRHMKLYSSAKFHAFNQKSHNPCTYPGGGGYPPHFNSSLSVTRIWVKTPKFLPVPSTQSEKRFAHYNSKGDDEDLRPFL